MEAKEKLNHLLACMAEESGEITQVVGKCLRFGINDSHPKHKNIPNIELLTIEFNDLIAVAEMLNIFPQRNLIEMKKEKVNKYIKYAENLK